MDDGLRMVKNISQLLSDMPQEDWIVLPLSRIQEKSYLKL